jgi:hypothetical protein
MADKFEIDVAVEQEFTADAPVLDLVESVDYFFSKLGISDSSYRNSSKKNNASEKIAGMTNTYLQPTRIGRKAVLGEVDFFYGLKFNLMPEVFENVPFDTLSDVNSFVQNRIGETLTGYISVHKGNLRLNVDVRNGVITELVKMGFDGQFTFLSKNELLTIGDLERFMKILITTGS